MFVLCCTFEKKVQASRNLHHMVQTNTLRPKKKNCLWLTVLKKSNLSSRKSQGKPEILTDAVQIGFCFSAFPMVHRHLLSPGRNLCKEI